MGQFKCGTTALFDTLAQHPDLLLLHTKEDFTQKCPRQQPRCVIKEANGFIRVADDGRWTETVLLNKYDPLTPDVPLNDTRPVLEASPYYLSGMARAGCEIRISRSAPPGCPIKEASPYFSARARCDIRIR